MLLLLYGKWCEQVPVGVAFRPFWRGGVVGGRLFFGGRRSGVSC